MRIVAGTDRPAEELEALAREHLVEHELCSELFWRLRCFRRARLEQAHHLAGALDSGRGVVISFAHVGPVHGAATLGRRHGRSVHIASALPPEGRADPSRARFFMQKRRIIEVGGGRALEAAGSYETLGGLLARGGVVGLAFDVPGRTPTPLFGRVVPVTSGTARLAHAAGAVVVPIVRRRQGTRIVSLAGAPLDPRDHEDWRSLHEALAARHQRWIDEAPAQYNTTKLLRGVIAAEGARSASPGAVGVLVEAG